MSNKFYMLVMILLGLAVKWLEDDAYADGARDKQEAWLDGFQRGVKSVDVLRKP